MADFPGSVITPPFILSTSRYFALWEGNARAGGAFVPASAGWGTASQAVYIPFSLPFPYLIRRMFWVNGSSAGSTHELAVYTFGGRQLVTTSGQTGTGNSAPQYITLGTPYLLSPGTYYLGYSLNATTSNRIFLDSDLSALIKRFTGILEQASASPLPALATFATPTTTSYPLVGFTDTPSGF